MQNGCIEWQKYKIKNGYGRLGIRNRKSVLVHRKVYEEMNGIILDVKSLVCHKCDNPSCINPDHLFIGSHKDNLLDSISKKRRLYKSGELMHNAKLNWDLVKYMREKRNIGWTTSKISNEININHGTVRSVCANRSWKQEARI